MPRIHHTCIAALLLTTIGVLPVWGQGGAPNRYYQPLHHSGPPGMAGRWTSQLAYQGRSNVIAFQALRVVLPTEGEVTVYSAADKPTVEEPSPATVNVAVGHVYRLKISNMPEFPGIELYPTVEMLSQLHPPAGKEAEYAIPISFDAEEIRHASNGRLVTKVVYLEQPNLAFPQESDGQLAPFEFPQTANLLEEADRLGRPMAIIRLGGRLPTAADSAGQSTFFGYGAPVRDLEAE